MLDHSGQPGVVWPEAGGELLKGWAGMRQMPFSQVHGHTSPYHWSSDRWRHNVPYELLKRAVVNVPKRHAELAWPDGTKIIGIECRLWCKGSHR
jgi:hypothetical protein